MGIFMVDLKMFLSFCGNLILLKRQKHNIVISLTEHIGDIVAAEPVSRYLKENHESSRITWVVDKKYEELIQGNPFIDNTITVTCFSQWIILRKFFDKKNLYDLHLDRKVCDKHHLLYKRNQPIDINNENYYQKGNLLYCFSRSGGIGIDPSIAPRLYFKNENLQLSPSIVMHTSSNSSKRNWTKEGWNELTNYLMKTFPNIKIIEIGFQNLIDTQSSQYVNYCGRKELADIAGVIQQCSLFIGIDSGFAHFANAMEKESLVLIGSYKGFINYMPYSGKFQRECESQIYYISQELSQLKFEKIKPALENKMRFIKTEVAE